MASYRDELDALEVMNAMLDRQAKRAMRTQPHTITQLLDGWAQVVDSIEESYDWSIYEYTNDLYIRDHLAEVLDVLKPGSLRWIADSVAATDARFRGATREVAEPIRGAPERGWWWRRIPLRPGDELAGDLASEGL